MHVVGQFDQRFGSIALTSVSKCKKMFSTGIIAVYSQLTFRLPSVPVTVRLRPQNILGGERFKPFSVGGKRRSSAVHRIEL